MMMMMIMTRRRRSTPITATVAVFAIGMLSLLTPERHYGVVEAFVPATPLTPASVVVVVVPRNNRARAATTTSSSSSSRNSNTCTAKTKRQILQLQLQENGEDGDSNADTTTADASADASSADTTSSLPTVLCDLQTLLKLTQSSSSLSTGGAAKVAIQAGNVQVNGVTEWRRAKKLFQGDTVTYQGVEYDVADVVTAHDYTYKMKPKKVKPTAQLDEYGNPEFGGRFRSDTWRAARKEKKEARKNENAAAKQKRQPKE